jgi:hypothetical protein
MGMRTPDAIDNVILLPGLACFSPGTNVTILKALSPEQLGENT